MARPPKPFIFRRWYCTSVGGKEKHKLCLVEEGLAKATRLLAIYLGKLQEEAEDAPRPVGIGIQRNASDVIVGVIHDEFLDYISTERPASYVSYRDKLKPFYERFANVPISSITEADGVRFKKWVLKERTWVKGSKKAKAKQDKNGEVVKSSLVKITGVGSVTANHFIRVAKIFFNWASKPARRYITVNPWKHIKFLEEKPRERLITDDEFSALLNECGDNDQDFKDLLIFLRYTAARPGEARKSTWDMVDFDSHQLNFSRKEAKTRKPRPISLIETVEQLLEERKKRLLKEGRLTKWLFTNADQQQWTGVAFSQKFRRLRNRCVRKNLITEEKGGEKLVLYSNRHTRGTEMLGKDGLDLYTVSKALGHKHTSTTENHYLHLTEQEFTDKVRKSRK